MNENCLCEKCRRPRGTNTTIAFRRKCTVQQQRLFGDRIERYLTNIGITPESYGHAKEALSLLPDCYCSERKKAFNAVHAYAKEHGWPSAILNAKKIYKQVLEKSKKEHALD